MLANEIKYQGLLYINKLCVCEREREGGERERERDFRTLSHNNISHQLHSVRYVFSTVIEKTGYINVRS
jgi:hypothetical protein